MGKTNLAFQKEYQRLNARQQEAVDHIGLGPLLVVAGPGTGKTQVLALRIANILLKTDARPDNILALTFTDVAAKNMRERLLKIIGKEAYYLQIHTFHSYCSQVMGLHPEYFPLKTDSQALDDLARYQIFEQLLDRFKPENLRPLNSQYFYVKKIIDAISDLKREGISPLQFEDILQAEAQQLEELQATSKNKSKIATAEKNLAKNKELLLLYQEYQQELASSERYDFDDMINFVLEAFRAHPDLLLEQQEQLQYFLVDEYQDTNSAQNQLVNLLASYWPEQGLEADLFVVGDPNQAIYRFQGASVENVLAFTRTYPSTKVITLDMAYRCPQNLYDCASELIKVNQLTVVDSQQSIDLSLRLQSSKAAGAKIKLYQAPSNTLESIYIAQQIKQLLSQGVKAQEIAVLYATHSEAAGLIEVLQKWSLPYQLNQGDDILESSLIQQLILLMQSIEALQNGSELSQLYQVLLLPFFQLDKLLVIKLGRISGQLSRQERKDVLIYDLYRRGRDFCNQQLSGQEISEAAWQDLARIMDKLSDLAAKSQHLSMTAWFEALIGDNGAQILPYLKTLPHKMQSLLELNTFFQKIKDLSAENKQLNLTTFLNYLTTYQAHRLKIRLKNPIPLDEAIYLSTAHGAKGMEWDYVFVLNFVDGKWGNKRQKNALKLPNGIVKNTDLSSKERNEDDRRLFYVALTRAKKELCLTYPALLETNHVSTSKVPSIFLSELPASELKPIEEAIQEAQVEAYLETLLEPKLERQVQLDEQALFAYLVKDFSLSVTALNNYLQDPRQFVTNNLLKLPSAKGKPLCFGTAVHSALERFYRFYQQQGQFASLDNLLTDFETALNKEILTASDFADELKHGRQVLSSYYQVFTQEKPQVFDVERSFGGAGRKIMLSDIHLTGKIDRLDWLDQEKGLVRVIDYKTGKNKSVNEIEVKTKGAKEKLSERELALPETIRGSYQRQLVFYKLLMDLDRQSNPRLEVAEVALDFVEPTKKGGNKFVRRSFTVSDEAIFDLKQVIKVVMAEIRELKFLEKLDF